MYIKDIINKKRTQENINKENDYHEYGHIIPKLNFDDCMSIGSFDTEDIRKKIKALNELDEE